MNNFYRPTSPEFQNFSDEKLDEIWKTTNSNAKILAAIFKNLQLAADYHTVFRDARGEFSEHDMIKIFLEYRESNKILPDGRVFFDHLQVDLDTDGQLWRVLPKELIEAERDKYVAITDWRDLHFADAAGMRRQIPKINDELSRQIKLYLTP